MELKKVKNTYGGLLLLIKLQAEATGSTGINGALLWQVSIQNKKKSSITMKWQNKIKNPTWSSIRLQFVKRTSVPNSVKNLGHIKCYCSSNSRPIKSPVILSHTPARGSAAEWEDLKPYWKSENNDIFWGDERVYCLQIFKFY